MKTLLTIIIAAAIGYGVVYSYVYFVPALPMLYGR
jgi:hypothetical protein